MTTNSGIDRKFSPVISSNMGGCWVRLIGSFKRSLMAIMRNRHRTEEVLQTLFNVIEYIVNSRSLTHMSTGPQDLVSILPNDLYSLGLHNGYFAIFNEKDLLKITASLTIFG